MFPFSLCYFIALRTLQSENFAEENELALDDELCYGKRCTANEHCCPGSVCVDVDGGKCSLIWFYFFFVFLSLSLFFYLKNVRWKEKKRVNRNPWTLQCDPNKVDFFGFQRKECSNEIYVEKRRQNNWVVEKVSIQEEKKRRETWREVHWLSIYRQSMCLFGCFV